MARAVVVGAGPAGLAVAMRLARQRHEVTVLEAADEVGGKLGWVEHEGRSEERRVGKECCLVCRSRWSPYH